MVAPVQSQNRSDVIKAQITSASVSFARRKSPRSLQCRVLLGTASPAKPFHSHSMSFLGAFADRPAVPRGAAPRSGSGQPGGPAATVTAPQSPPPRRRLGRRRGGVSHWRGGIIRPHGGGTAGKLQPDRRRRHREPKHLPAARRCCRAGGRGEKPRVGWSLGLLRTCSLNTHTLTHPPIGGRRGIGRGRGEAQGQGQGQGQEEGTGKGERKRGSPAECVIACFIIIACCRCWPACACASASPRTFAKNRQIDRHRQRQRQRQRQIVKREVPDSVAKNN
jgi:hypothetical protein